MAQQAQSPSDFEGRPLVFRNATVISVDPTIGTLVGADVLVVDQLIAAVGQKLPVPDGTLEIDSSGGILIPGMIDTHRHMYQTAMRGFGADWTLTDYFYFYYVNHGSKFRPQDVYAGNLLAAIEAVDSGVTTTLDWSHGLQTTDHADAALDALERVPARFVFSYGNLAGAPQDWSTDPAFKAFVNRRLGHTTDMLSFGMSFDVPGDPEFPERAAFEVARELGVPVSTHSGAWGATGDAGILLMAEHGFLSDQVTHVHVGDRERAKRWSGLSTELPPSRVWNSDLAFGRQQRLVQCRHVFRYALDAQRRSGPRASHRAREEGDRHQQRPAGRRRHPVRHSGRSTGNSPGRKPWQDYRGPQGRPRSHKERWIPHNVPDLEPRGPCRLPVREG
jgi:hypothetical protein